MEPAHAGRVMLNIGADPSASREIPPDILRRLRAGEQVEGYTVDVRPVQVPRGTSVGADAEFMDDPSGATETLIYRTTGRSTWKTNGDTADVFDADGQFVGESSGDSTALGLAKFIAASAGSYFGAQGLNGAMAGGTAAAGGGTTAATTGAQGINWGTVGANAGKGALMNGGMTAARGGDLSDVMKAAAIGAVSGGAGGVGQGLGWNPAVTGAVTGGATTALRGGDAQDILQGAAAGGFSGYVNSEGLTGNQTMDRAIASGGGAALQGADGKGILTSALQGGINGATRDTGRGLLSGGTGDALSEDNIIRFDQGGDAAGGQEGGGMANVYDDAYDMSEWNPSYNTGPSDDGLQSFELTPDTYDHRAGTRGSDGYGDSEGMTGDETAAYDGYINTMETMNGVGGWASDLVKNLFGGLSSRDWASLGLGGLNAVQQSSLFDKAAEREQATYTRNRADTLADAERRRQQELEDDERLRQRTLDDRGARIAEEDRLRNERFQRMKPVTEIGLLAPHFQRTAP